VVSVTDNCKTFNSLGQCISGTKYCKFNFNLHSNKYFKIYTHQINVEDEINILISNLNKK